MSIEPAFHAFGGCPFGGCLPFGTCQDFTLAARFLVITRNDKCSNSHIAKACFWSSGYSHCGNWSRRYLSHWGFHLHFHGGTEQFHLLISFCISSWGKYLFESCGLFFIYVAFLLSCRILYIVEIFPHHVCNSFGRLSLTHYSVLWCTKLLFYLYLTYFPTVI